jgi:hypothetical protein
MNLLSFVETEAQKQGLAGNPKIETEFQTSPVNKIQAHIQAAIYEVQQTVKPRTAMQIVSELRKEAHEKLTPIHAEKTALMQEQHLNEQKKKQAASNKKECRSRGIMKLAEWIIAAMESILCLEALRVAGMPLIPAYATAIALGLVIGFGLSHAARYIKQAANKAQKRIRYAMILIPAFCICYALGMLRAHGYEVAQTMDISTTGEQVKNSNISGLALGLISFLIFTATLFFSVRFARTKQEEEEDKSYQKIQEEEKEIAKKMNANEAKANAIQKDCDEACHEAYTNFEMAYAAEQRLKSLSNKLITDYITTNIRYRTNAIPEFFANPPKPNYITLFDNLKKEQP